MKQPMTAGPTALIFMRTKMSQLGVHPDRKSSIYIPRPAVRHDGTQPMTSVVVECNSDGTPVGNTPSGSDGVPCKPRRAFHERRLCAARTSNEGTKKQSADEPHLPASILFACSLTAGVMMSAPERPLDVQQNAWHLKPSLITHRWWYLRPRKNGGGRLG